MSAQSLADKYEQYIRDEQNCQQAKIDLQVSRDAFFLSILFETQFAALMALVIKGIILLGSIPSTGNIDYVGGAAALGIFGGAGVLVWAVFGNAAYWTNWKSRYEDHRRKVHQSKLERKLLSQTSKERKEFFRFYEMYQTDENFRDRYDRLMTSDTKTDQQEFLEKLKGDMYYGQSGQASKGRQEGA